MRMPKRVTGRYLPRLFLLLLGSSAIGLIGCGGASGEGDEGMETAYEAAPIQLGPVDGFDLAPVDLERVAVGSLAPDFSLQTLAGDTLTLSAFRGVKNVILVFYRGHW